MWLAEHRGHQLFLGTSVDAWFEDVFVTDLAGIRVLSPSGRTDISRSVSCVSKETRVSKSWFCAVEQCAPCVYLCVHPLLLSAERGRSAHQRASQTTAVPWIRNSGSARSSGHLKLSWNQNQPINLRESLYVKQGESRLVFQAVFLKITQKFLI